MARAAETNMDAMTVALARAVVNFRDRQLPQTSSHGLKFCYS